ncbi:hypothetical protein D3C86_1407870 [compost metagenome]
MTDGEFRGAETGEIMQRFHGKIEIIEAVERHIFRQRNGGKTVADARRCGGQDFDVAGIVAGKCRMQARRHLPHALHDAQGLEVFGGERHEG